MVFLLLDWVRDRKNDVVITINKKKIVKKVYKRKYNIQRIDGLEEKESNSTRRSV